MKRGDVVFVNLPMVPGSNVQGGRRPAILVAANVAQRGNPMVMLIPLTTKLAATRFTFTYRIEPSQENGLSATSIALVFQLCAADRTNIASVIGRLKDSEINMLDDLMRQMLGL